MDAADPAAGRPAGRAFFTIRQVCRGSAYASAVEVDASAVTAVQGLPSGGTRLHSGRHHLDVLEHPVQVLRALSAASAPGWPAPSFTPAPAPNPVVRTFVARCRSCRAMLTANLHAAGDLTWRAWEATPCPDPARCTCVLPVPEDESGTRRDLLDPTLPGVR